ncbi:hypothetical protein TUM3792_38020 [Shewanella sp. MBTL60-007]|nr:hypothetical protein [Shewanella sp. MBTL60-007]GIU28855.1 hypothetical protein TUM3792_38020 [Shewanella sp. MBTL60-007]
MAIKHFLSLSYVLAISVIMLSSSGLMAAQPATNRTDSLSEQAEKAKLRVESEQLKKAREAAKQTEAREKKVLDRQESGDWESEQREKAQQQFNKRESRQEKYLREAKEAASRERKIPKPFE